MEHRESLPSVTVIMPIRNEQAYISRSLCSVLQQEYPPEKIEILIVDGMSTDQTRAIIENTLSEQHAIRVYIIDNPGRIVATGLNIALAQATGEVIVRVDGHCELAPDYVLRSVECLKTGEADVVGGPIETIGETCFSSTIAIAMSSSFGVGGSAFRTTKTKKQYVDTVAFPAFPHSVLARGGPFDEELIRNQDDEYNYRLRKLGARILLCPDIQSKYYSRSSLKSLWKQYFQYGFYKTRVLQKHPAQMRPRQFVPPLFALGVLVGAVLASLSKPLRRLWYAGLATYLLTNVAASVKLARANGWKHLERLPLVFFILHFSYGLGFLAGLFHFRDRWGK